MDSRSLDRGSYTLGPFYTGNHYPGDFLGGVYDKSILRTLRV